MNQTLLQTRPFLSTPPGRRLTHLGILAIFPFLLAFLNDYWAFTGTQGDGWIDPWLYTSYFLHLKAQLLAFPAAYYGDRLSTNVPGWIIYHLFGPWAGNYVLKLAVIYTAVFALYYAVLTLFNERTALLSAALISVQPYFLTAFGWDYVDGFGIAYYSLSLLCVLRAATSEKWRAWLFAGGVGLTCLVTSHLLWLNVAWTVPLVYYLVNRTASKHEFRKSLVVFLSGVASAFVGFCGIYFLLTGHWFYLASSVNHTLEGLGPAQKVTQPVAAWTGISHWLDPYNVLILAALWCLFRREETPRQKICLALFVISYATIWIWELLGFPFTMLLYYSDFIFPAYVLALAALLTDWVDRLSPRIFAWIVGAVLVLGGGLVLSAPALDQLLQSIIIFVQQHPAFGRMWPNQALWVSAVGAVAALSLCIARSRTTWLPGIFVAGTLLVGGLEMTLHQRQGWFSDGGAHSGFTNKQAFRLILDADAWADKIRSDRRVLMWYNEAEPRVGVTNGLSSLYLYRWSVLNVNFPDLAAADNDKIQQYGDILVVSWRPDAVASARRSLTASGWIVAQERETTIRNENLELHLGFFDVVPSNFDVNAIVTREGLQPLPDGLTIGDLQPVSPATTFQPGQVVHITTPPGQWDYAAYAPLRFPAADGEGLWIRLLVKVQSGIAGFGILTGSEKAFYARTAVGAGPNFRDVLLPVAHPDDSHKLIIENDTPGGQKADLVISQVGVYARPDSKIWKRLHTPAETVKEAPTAGKADGSGVIAKEGLQELPGALKTAEIQPTSPATALKPGPEVHITTPAAQWAYAAYVPLNFPSGDGEKLWIRLSVKILSGTAGFGILNASEKGFYARTSLGSGSTYKDVILEVAHPGDTHKLIIENDTPGGQKADLLVSQITVFARPGSKIWKQMGEGRAKAH